MPMLNKLKRSGIILLFGALLLYAVVVILDNWTNIGEFTGVLANDNSPNNTKSIIGEISTNNMETKSNTIPDTAIIGTQTMLVAGGCFWCVEADLEKLPGVLSAVSGYADGSSSNPTYESYAQMGFREVVEVTYNPELVTYEQILIYAIKHMDPTDGEGSFHDRGRQYSPALYYKTISEKEIIENLILDINTNGPYDTALAVDILVEPTFWSAEDYHQDYYKGTLTKVKYLYYRNASGRDDLIKKYWGEDTGLTLSWRTDSAAGLKIYNWTNYFKPEKTILKSELSELAYKVTQEEGTERSYSSPLDKNNEVGIYVDILSGEPLFSSRDKFDSGTGWPSFVRPITATAVTERIDKKLFSTRTEIRSAVADNHLGHVFPDGPNDRGGLRYCMNGVALEFVPKDSMVERGYEDYLVML